MPAPARHDSGTATALVVTLDGSVVPGVTGVAGLGLQRDVIDFREGNDPTGATRRVPGRVQAGDLVLTRTLTTDPTFETWVRASGPDGAVVPSRDVRIRFHDRRGDPVRGYRLLGAWPRGLEVAGSTVPGGPGLLEHLTVSYDACVPEQP